MGIDGERYPLVRRCAAVLASHEGKAGIVAGEVITQVSQQADLTTTEQSILSDIHSCEGFTAPLKKLFDRLYLSPSLGEFESHPAVVDWVQQLASAREPFTSLKSSNGGTQRRLASLVKLDPSKGTRGLARAILRHHAEVAREKSGTAWLGLDGDRVILLNPAYRPETWDWEGASVCWVHGYYVYSLKHVMDGLNTGGA